MKKERGVSSHESMINDDERQPASSPRCRPRMVLTMDTVKASSR